MRQTEKEEEPLEDEEFNETTNRGGGGGAEMKSFIDPPDESMSESLKDETIMVNHHNQPLREVQSSNLVLIQNSVFSLASKLFLHGNGRGGNPRPPAIIRRIVLC